MALLYDSIQAITRALLTISLSTHSERKKYAKWKAKHGVKKLKADFVRLGLSGTPEEKLPSEDEAEEYFSGESKTLMIRSLSIVLKPPLLC